MSWREQILRSVALAGRATPDFRGKYRIVYRLHAGEGYRGTPLRGIVRTKSGLLFHCETSSYIEWELFFFGVYEPETTNLLPRLIRPGATCIDAGANVGIMSITMARAAGGTGRVIAFEPNLPIADRLEANVRLNGLGNLRIERVCLGAMRGMVELHVPREGISNVGQSSLYLARHPCLSDTDVAKRSVPMITLDEYLSSMNPASLDLVKMDVEGAELDLLAGAARSLDRWHPILVFEANAKTAILAQTTVGDLFGAIESQGYTIYKAEESGRVMHVTAEERRRAETQADYCAHFVAFHGGAPAALV